MKSIVLFLSLLGGGTSGFAQEKNHPPTINSLSIDGKKAPRTAYLNPGEKYLIRVDVSDPEKDKLVAIWALYTEAALKKAKAEKKEPVSIPDMVTGNLENVMLDVPVTAGPYRLTLTVADPSGNKTRMEMPLIVLN